MVYSSEIALFWEYIFKFWNNLEKVVILFVPDTRAMFHNCNSVVFHILTLYLR